MSRFITLWVDELTRLMSRPAERELQWHGILLQVDPGFDVYVRQGAGTRLLGRLGPDATAAQAAALASDLKRHVKRPTILLRLSPDKVVSTRLTLPAGVRDMLAPIISNQLERLAPWPAAEALFGWRVAERASSDGQIGVDVWIADREWVEAVVGDLAALGIVVNAVDAGTTVEEASRVNLLGKPNTQQIELQRRRVRAGLGSAAALALLAIAASTGYLFYLSSLRSDVEQEISRELTAAMAVNSPRSAEARRLRDLVLDQRRKVPSVPIMLEMLSRAIPDGAYLDRLELRDGVLLIAGRAENASSLIGPLEETGHFENVQFAAPTTRREGESRDEFSLSARVKPITSFRGTE